MTSVSSSMIAERLASQRPACNLRPVKGGRLSTASDQGHNRPAAPLEGLARAPDCNPCSGP
eukprot:15435559-Alexandrium_andersonii.AAC.1